MEKLMEERRKIHGMDEIAYALGMIICAFAVCLGTKANLGISVVAVPGYLYSYLLGGEGGLIPWLTQGWADFLWQVVQLGIMCLIIMKFKAKYLLSFLSSFIGGRLIDLWFFVLGGNGAYENIVARIFAMIASQICLGFAVALFFRTSLPVQICELLMVEISKRFKLSASKIKLIYDVIILVLSLVISLIFTRGLTGIGIGTIVIAICTSPLTVLFGKLLDRFFVFDSIFKKRRSKQA